MLIDLWVHRVTSSYLRSPLGADDGVLPLREVWEKCCDGLTWMSAFDRHPRAIGGLEMVHARAAEHAAAGRRWKPWLVPHGRVDASDDGAYARAEGRRAAAVARSAARGGRAVAVLDVEPHYHGGVTPQFWRDDLGADAGSVQALLGAFAGAGGDEVWLSIDARRPHLAPIAFEAWWRHEAVTRVLPQVYWTDFLRGVRTPTPKDARKALDEAITTLAAWGVAAAEIAPVLPADAGADSLIAAYLHAYEQGTARPSIWQRLSLEPEAASALGRIDDPWDRAFDLGAVRGRLDEAIEALEAARLALEAREPA